MFCCLNPPYYLHEHLYDHDYIEAFTRHEEIATLLKQVKGKFLLSYNNDPYIRDLYKDFTIEEVDAQYTVSGSILTEIGLRIRNYISDYSL